MEGPKDNEHGCKRELHCIAETLCAGLADVVNIGDEETKRERIEQMVDTVRHMAECFAGIPHGPRR